MSSRDNGEKKINLKIASATHRIGIAIRPNQHMELLFSKFCKETGTDHTKAQFLDPRGRVIKDTDTPFSLKLMDGDEIKVMSNEKGGSF